MIPIPWVDKLALKELEDIFTNATSPFNVYEWGSGGSTIWFGLKRLGEVYSVEHDFNWHSNVNTQVNILKLDNIHLMWVSSLVEPGCMHSYSIPNYNFEDYYSHIKTVNKKFDLIFVDGRARVICFKNACDYVKRNGFIILHDSEREMYQECHATARSRGFSLKEIREERSLLICQKINGTVA